MPYLAPKLRGPLRVKALLASVASEQFMSAAVHNCGTCGWEVSGETCPMCGRAVATKNYLEGPPEAPPASGPRPEDFPELAEAFRAWKVENWHQVVQLTLAHIGMVEQSNDAPAGQSGWTLEYESAAVYVTYDPKQRRVVVESPVVWVAQHQRVPLMRTLLELNCSNEGAARFALRGPMVILRYADHVENVSPPKLLSAVREVAVQADEHDNWLAEAFGAKMVGPEAIARGLDWKYIGRPVPLPGIDSVNLDEDEALPRADDLLFDWVERALAAVQAHDAAMENQVSGLIVRSLGFVIRELCTSASPATRSVVLHWLRDLMVREADEQLTALDAVVRLRELPEIRGELSGRAPLPLAEILPLSTDYRSHTRQRIQGLRKLPREKLLHDVVITGLACELLLRAEMPNERAYALRVAARSGVLETTYQGLMAALE